MDTAISQLHAEGIFFFFTYGNNFINSEHLEIVLLCIAYLNIAQYLKPIFLQ